MPIRTAVTEIVASEGAYSSEAMVAELPKKKDAIPPMPGGGGMDF
jgi:hypothetical protein